MVVPCRALLSQYVAILAIPEPEQARLKALGGGVLSRADYAALRGLPPGSLH